MGSDDLEERALPPGADQARRRLRPRRAPQPGGDRQEPHRRPAAPRAVRRRGATWGVDVPALLADIDARLADPALAAATPPEIRRIPPHEPSRRHPGRRSPVRRHPPVDPARPAVLLDVREAYEFQEVRVPGSLFIPMSELGARVDEVPKDRPVLVLCAAGSRSSR